MGSSDSIAPQSLFDQKLDRALLVIYFVGAVVPLLMLAVVSSGPRCRHSKTPPTSGQRSSSL